MKKDTTLRHNPLIAGEPTLDFIDEDLSILTEDQKTDKFFIKWMDTVHPFSRYEKFFKDSVREPEIVLRDVKLFYKKLVLPEKWTEQKYVTVLEDVFSQNLILSVAVLDVRGRLFDRGLLTSQRQDGLRGRRGSK